MKKYLKIWLYLGLNSFQTILATRFGSLIFVFGKLFRFGMFIAFVYFLFSGAQTILGYGRYEALLFLITFSFLSAVTQMFFRETYRFRGKIVSGAFDFDLVKPIHPLLPNIGGGFDLLDLFTMPIFLYALWAVISQLSFDPVRLFAYLLLLLNGLVMGLAIHVLVASFGIITTEVDHAMLVYRDIEAMGRFPVDIYKEPLREILTFVVPVGLMFTIPAKALLGLLSSEVVFISFFIGLSVLILSFKFWDFAVKKYSSASS